MGLRQWEGNMLGRKSIAMCFWSRVAKEDPINPIQRTI